MQGASGDGPEIPEAGEFAAFVDRYRVDRILSRQHWLRLGLCVVATAAVVAYNVGHRHASEHMQTRFTIAQEVVLAYLVGCLAVMILHGLYLRRQLHRRAENLHDEVRQVINFVHRWGNLLMFLAATGHLVVVFGTMLGLDLRSQDGRVLLGGLVPSLLVFAHGVIQVPTRARLLALHQGL
jgi:hypothetical protein